MTVGPSLPSGCETACRPTTEAKVVALEGRDPLAEGRLSRELQERYLIWDTFFAGRRRVDITPLLLSERLHQEAVRVAEGAVAVIQATAARAHRDPAEASHYRYHPDVTKLIQASHGAGDDA